MNLRPYIAFAVLFFAYTEIDVHAQSIFAPFGIPAYSNTYFLGWETIAIFFALSLGLKFKSFALGFSFLLLARNGTEDFWYYALQFQAPPSHLPWLYTWLPSYSVATPFTLDLAVFWGLGAVIFLISAEKNLEERVFRWGLSRWMDGKVSSFTFAFYHLSVYNSISERIQDWKMARRIERVLNRIEKMHLPPGMEAHLAVNLLSDPTWLVSEEKEEQES